MRQNPVTSSGGGHDGGAPLYAINVRGKARFEINTIPLQCMIFVGLLVTVAVYYLFLLSNGSFEIFVPEMLDKAFDNMLVHLLRGEFTVDREAIGFEAFTRDGKTYAYFGILPAVLRLFAMPFTDIAQAHLARLSCLTALVIFIALQLRMLLIVHQSVPSASRRPEFFVVIMMATILSGPQLYILSSASIYHEAILWSAAMAAAYNLIIVRTAFCATKLRGRDLVYLAALAGLAINTRPSIGISLCVGTILLVGWTAWFRDVIDHGSGRFSGKAVCFAALRLPPLAILGLAAVVVGTVNFERWGHPLIFADFHYYDMRLNAYPNLEQVIDEYGEFDLGRVWIGTLYYTTGIPYILKDVPPFAEFLRDRVMGIEAPPITPILTNPLTIFLAIIGLYYLWWRSKIGTQNVAILRLVLLGHASTVLLILAAMSFTLRYRFDFAPFMTLAALIGYRSVSLSVSGAPDFWRKRVYIAAIGLCFLGILFSHYVLLVHKVWSIAVPMEVRLSLLPFAPFHYTTLSQ